MGDNDDADKRPGTDWVYNPCGCDHKSHKDGYCPKNMAPNAPLGSKCSTCIAMGH